MALRTRTSRKPSEEVRAEETKRVATATVTTAWRVQVRR